MQHGHSSFPMVGTPNHHVHVKGENAVPSRQRKLQIFRRRELQEIAFFFSQEALWCL